MQKRVVRVISYEGSAEWITRLLGVSALKRVGHTLLTRSGTVKELQRVELKEGERLRVVVERDE